MLRAVLWNTRGDGVSRGDGASLRAQGAPGASWGTGRRLRPWHCLPSRDKALFETTRGKSNLSPPVWKPSLSSFKCNPFDIRGAFGRGFPGFLWQASPYKEQALQQSGTKLPLLRSTSTQNGKQAACGVTEAIGRFEENTACLICRYACLQPEPGTARPSAVPGTELLLFVLKLSVRWLFNCMSLKRCVCDLFGCS